MMILMALLFRAVMNMRSDGNSDNRNAIGVSGKVHLTIPPSRTGSGKVHILLQGAYTEREAVTDDEHPIPTGCEVVVIGLSGQTDLVVRRK
jgi:membrane protein implicated in regulation of membrane protease activity